MDTYLDLIAPVDTNEARKEYNSYSNMMDEIDKLNCPQCGSCRYGAFGIKKEIKHICIDCGYVY